MLENEKCQFCGKYEGRIREVKAMRFENVCDRCYVALVKLANPIEGKTKEQLIFEAAAEGCLGNLMRNMTKDYTPGKTGEDESGRPFRVEFDHSITRTKFLMTATSCGVKVTLPVQVGRSRVYGALIVPKNQLGQSSFVMASTKSELEKKAVEQIVLDGYSPADTSCLLEFIEGGRGDATIWCKNGDMWLFVEEIV